METPQGCLLCREGCMHRTPALIASFRKVSVTQKQELLQTTCKNKHAKPQDHPGWEVSPRLHR